MIKGHLDFLTQMNQAWMCLHHKSHQLLLKFFRINIEPLQKFFEICGVWPNFLLDGTSFITTRMKDEVPSTQKFDPTPKFLKSFRSNFEINSD